jgi:hypothetical protein
MVLARLFGFAVVGAVLAGCAGAPLEHREPYKVVTVDMPAQQVYDNLNAYPYCGFNWRLDSRFDGYSQSFEIRFIANSPLSAGGQATDLIRGRAEGDGGTKLTLSSFESFATPISQKFLNRLQTGKCDG